MTAEYRAWSNAIDRCERTSNKSYRDYGGRGISMCQRWRSSFGNFLEDMGRKPSPTHMLDRENNHGNYEPGNCRWVTRTEQNRNRRNTVRVSFQGQIATLAEWADRLGVKQKWLSYRLRTKKMTMEEISIESSSKSGG